MPNAKLGANGVSAWNAIGDQDRANGDYTYWWQTARALTAPEPLAVPRYLLFWLAFLHEVASGSVDGNFALHVVPLLLAARNLHVLQL